MEARPARSLRRAPGTSIRGPKMPGRGKIAIKLRTILWMTNLVSYCILE